MGKLQNIVEMYPEETFLTADGFDDAIIGVGELSMRLVYSIPRCLGCLIVEQEMTLTEACEYFEYNAKYAYVGEKTPIFVETLEELR